MDGLFVTFEEVLAGDRTGPDDRPDAVHGQAGTGAGQRRRGPPRGAGRDGHAGVVEAGRARPVRAATSRPPPGLWTATVTVRRDGLRDAVDRRRVEGRRPAPTAAPARSRPRMTALSCSCWPSWWAPCGRRHPSAHHAGVVATSAGSGGESVTRTPWTAVRSRPCGCRPGCPRGGPARRSSPRQGHGARDAARAGRPGNVTRRGPSDPASAAPVAALQRAGPPIAGAVRSSPAHALAAQWPRSPTRPRCGSSTRSP